MSASIAHHDRQFSGLEESRSSPLIRTPDPKNARHGFFEADEFAAVLAELPEYLRAPLTFAYHTGWRARSEVLPLR